VAAERMLRQPIMQRDDLWRFRDGVKVAHDLPPVISCTRRDLDTINSRAFVNSYWKKKQFSSEHPVHKVPWRCLHFGLTKAGFAQKGADSHDHRSICSIQDQDLTSELNDDMESKITTSAR
jgi:hypothetical protein